MSGGECRWTIYTSTCSAPYGRGWTWGCDEVPWSGFHTYPISSTWRTCSQAACLVPWVRQRYCPLQRELTNHKEHAFLELQAARLEAEWLADTSRRVFDGPSTQPYATPVEKKTMVNAVAAVAHAVPIQTHSPGHSLTHQEATWVCELGTKEAVRWLFLLADAREPRLRLLLNHALQAWEWEGECIQQDPHPSLMMDREELLVEEETQVLPTMRLL